jgi:ribonuclease D
MIASRLCGYQELGLAALVAKHFDVKLSKASQKANWGMRPLSRQMIDYAMCDTKYLLPLAAIIEADLHRLGRWDWFVESRDRMLASAREPRERDESKAWRISGSAALSPRAQSVLRVLWYWRDGEARAWDRPPFHVMSNDDLVRISEKAVRGEAYSTPRMSGRRRKSFEVVLALALHIPENEWPVQPKTRRRRPSREETERFDHLKSVRDKVAAELALDPSIIAPRNALEAASVDPSTGALMNWQRRLLGLPVAEKNADAA